MRAASVSTVSPSSTGTVVEFEGRRYEPANLERGDAVEVQIRDSGGQLLAERILVTGQDQSVTR